MDLFIYSFLLALLSITSASATRNRLYCWTCKDEMSNDRCQAKGKLTRCRWNEHSCENEVRRVGDQISVTKRCKQLKACVNVNIQNPRAAWHPAQCNLELPDVAVCRCCCQGNACNHDPLPCLGKHENDLIENILKATKPPRRLDARDCPDLPWLENGFRLCSNERYVGSVCKFYCNIGFLLAGPRAATCFDTGSDEYRWDNGIPHCTPILLSDTVTTDDLVSHTATWSPWSVSSCDVTCGEGVRVKTRTCPFYGNCPGSSSYKIPCSQPPCHNWSSWSFGSCSTTCGTGMRTKKRTCPVQGKCFGPSSMRVSCSKPSCNCAHILDSVEHGTVKCDRPDSRHSSVRGVCRVYCEFGYVLKGRKRLQCMDFGEYRRWDYDVPTCEVITCEKDYPTFSNIEHGQATCSNSFYFQSKCQYQCTDPGYFLFPYNRKETHCDEHAHFTPERPCCITTEIMQDACRKPYDLVVVLDSSSSIGNQNWLKQVDFVKNTVKFVYQHHSRYGIFRYNKHIDYANEIKLKDGFGKQQLLDGLDNLPYDGSGTYTGQALRYAFENSLSESSGNRADVQDILLLVTDGRSQDNVLDIADEILASDTVMYVVGIGLNEDGEDTVMEIVKRRDRYTNIKGGFVGLSSDLIETIQEVLCNPCRSALKIDSYQPNGHTADTTIKR